MIPLESEHTAKGLMIKGLVDTSELKLTSDTAEVKGCAPAMFFIDGNVHGEKDRKPGDMRLFQKNGALEVQEETKPDNATYEAKCYAPLPKGFEDYIDDYAKVLPSVGQTKQEEKALLMEITVADGMLILCPMFDMELVIEVKAPGYVHVTALHDSEFFLVLETPIEYTGLFRGYVRVL